MAKPDSEPKTLCYTPTADKKPTRIPTWKYAAIRSAVLRVVPECPPGVAAKDLPGLVAQQLDAHTKQKIGSISWHTTTVKLNMEVDGELLRLPKLKPQHLIRPPSAH